MIDTEQSRFYILYPIMMFWVKGLLNPRSAFIDLNNGGLFKTRFKVATFGFISSHYKYSGICFIVDSGHIYEFKKSFGIMEFCLYKV